MNAKASLRRHGAIERRIRRAAWLGTAAAIVAATIGGIAAAQSTITQWTFEGDVLTPATGSGTAGLLGTATGSFATGSGGGRAWNTTTYAAQSTNSGTVGVQFLFGTTGYKDLSFSFNHRASGTASRWSQIDYTLDGGTNWTTGFWNNNGGLTPHDTFHSFNVDFTGVTGANDNANFGLRIVSIFSPQAFDQNSTLAPFAANTAYMRANAGAVYSPSTSTATGDYGTSGTWRFDNVTLSGFVQGAKNISWNTTDGAWNTSDANWTGGGSIFAEGDNVTFAGAAGGTVTVDAAGVAPGSTTVSAAAGTYTFAGGAIGGTGALVKSGAGTVALTATNTFAGGTTIDGGVLSVDGADRLGSGAVAIGGGTLRSVAGGDLSLANALSVAAAGGTIDTGAANVSLLGGASLAGTLTKTGAGTLVLDTATVTTGGFDVAAGTLQIGASAASVGTLNLAAANSLTGDLVIRGVQRVNVNAGGSVSGSGAMQFAASGALLSQATGNAGGAVAASIELNSTGIAFTPGVMSTGSYTPASFTTTIGATTGGALAISGPISGDSDVNISNNSSTGGGRGLLVLSGQSTYAGNTIIDANTPDNAANVRLGVANALPVTGGLIYGTRTGVGAAVLDLDGFDQTVAFVADGPQFVAGSKFLTITNLGTSDSTFTIGGASSATFGGVLTNGAGALLHLAKDGAGTQTLTGAHTYGGTTDILAGSLVVEGSLASTMLVDVRSGAAIGGAGVIAGSLLFRDGSDLLFDVANTLIVDGASVSFENFGVTNLRGFGTSVPDGTYTLLAGFANIDTTNLRNFGVANAYSLGDGRHAFFTGGDLVLHVTAVPEPSAVVLAALGMAIVSARALSRRRR